MAYFPDLTPHTYAPVGGLEILNIGWLDEGQKFAKGATSLTFQQALRALCDHPILLHRGCHECYFCSAASRDSRGNGQVRVKSARGIWYAAPTLVHHYVTSHQYSPPDDFIDAVLSPIAVGTNYGWNPELDAMLSKLRQKK